MSGTKWRAVSVPTQKTSGDLPRASGLTTSPGRTGAEGSQARAIAGLSAGRQTTTGLISTAASAATTPDNAAYTVPDLGITVTMDVQLRTWTPASDHWLMSQGAAGNLAWNFIVQSNGRLRINVSTDGTAVTGAESTVATGFLLDSRHWVRGVILPNFIGQCAVNYLTSENGRDFVGLGGTVNVGAGVTVFNSTADLSIPGTTSSTDQITYSADFVVGSTRVAQPRFDTQPPRQPSFTDDSARPWTVNAPALIGVV